MPEKKTAEVDAVAQVYARSLFELADAQEGLTTIESVFEELTALVELIAADPQLTEFMRSVVIPADRKRASISKIFGEGKVSALLLRFLLVLNDKERLGHLPGITLAYQNYYWEKIGRLAVTAYTPKPLDTAEAEQVTALIRKALGKEAVLNNTVEPAMLGGLKLRIGDKLIDASISTRLAKLRESLTKSGAENARAGFAAMIDE